jgi:hypothetical protein
MDNLRPLLMVAFAVADGTFLHGLLSGLHLPQDLEGLGATLGGVLLLFISQLIQGHLTARKWRKLMQGMMPKPPNPKLSAT